MRTLARSLTPGDILVGDVIDETCWTFVMLQGIGCDGVFEINGSRSHPEKRRTHLVLKLNLTAKLMVLRIQNPRRTEPPQHWRTLS